MEERLHLGKKIKEIIDAKGISQAEFARSLGMQRQNIRRVVLERESLDSDLIGRISEILDCNLFELLGQGSSQVNADGLPYFEDLPVSGGRIEQYPQILKHNGAGVLSLPLTKGAEFVFPVIGCSMQPTIKEGEIIGVAHIDNYETTNPDRIYMIVTRDNERMIKRIIAYNEEAGSITIASDNPAYPPSRLAVDMVLDIYKVVFHMVIETL